MNSSFSGSFKGPFAGNFIAVDAFGGGALLEILPAAWSVYQGWLEGTAGSSTGPTDNPVDSTQIIGVYANTSYLYIETEHIDPQKVGTTIYCGIEGWNGGALMSCSGLGSGWSWRSLTQSGLKAYLVANAGVPLEVTFSATP